MNWLLTCLPAVSDLERATRVCHAHVVPPERAVVPERRTGANEGGRSTVWCAWGERNQSPRTSGRRSAPTGHLSGLPSRIRHIAKLFVLFAGLGVGAVAQGAENGCRPETATAGADLGEESRETDRCRQIAQRMQLAEQMLRNRDASAQTQREQQRIIADLTQLIASLEQPSGTASSAGRQDRASQPPSKPLPGVQSSASGAVGAAGAAKASSGTRSDWKTEPSTGSELLIRVWGQLPAQLQEQIQSPVHEQFLPGYERLISEYYQRLAENE